MNTSKDDCEVLLNTLLPDAKQHLRRWGEFFPFGGTMDIDGKIALVMGYDGREQPPSADVIGLIKYEFIEGARSGRLKATALVYDVRVALPSTGVKSDAVAVSLNHRDGYSVIVLFPYRLKGRELTMDAAFAQQGEADIFPRP
ncbi:hypothetical protein KXS07_05805 [Inquilinus limosus]|uniref:hypothetical protein n=1 Tax=Inquilinus limosus TaxID=171674 RepID=UPI003F147740